MRFWQDVRHALRQIARRPGQPIVIVLSLACALGINGALFAFVNGIWLAPWAVAQADRLRVVQPAVPIATWRAWRAQGHAFEDLAALTSGPLLRLAASTTGSGRLVHLDFVSSNYFDALGATLVVGRGFAEREPADAADADVDVTVSCVISHQLWQTHFTSDPRIVGRTFTLDPLGVRRPAAADRAARANPNGARAGLTLRVIGVASPGFDGVLPLRTQLWLPLDALSRMERAGSRAESSAPRAERTATRVTVFGRLADGVTDARATAELDRISRARDAAGAIASPPGTSPAPPSTTAAQTDPPAAGSPATDALAPGSQSTTSAATATTSASSPAAPVRLRTTDLYSQSPQPLQTKAMIGSLIVGIVFITLIACANVSNLLLARGHARRGEIALRLALGAPRGQLVRLLLTECFLLTLVASLIGLIIAIWLPNVLLQRLLRGSALGLGELLRFSFPLDWRMFAWTLAMAIVACLSFGLAPARRGTNLRPGDVLKDAQGQAGAALLTRLLSWQTIVSVMALAIGGFLLRSTGIDASISAGASTGAGVVASASAATLAGRGGTAPHDATLATAQLTIVFGGVALALGAVGLFSVLEFAVRQRTRDIGIRRALGAETRHIVATVGLPAARAMLRGLVIGSLGAAGAGAFMARADLPAGVRPLDPLTYVCVALIVLFAGLLAASVPLRRALRIAPADALRRE